MDDRGFFLTLQAIRRQLAAMPKDLYLVRVIHHRTRQAFPGERLWTAEQLAGTATLPEGPEGWTSTLKVMLMVEYLPAIWQRNPRTGWNCSRARLTC